MSIQIIIIDLRDKLASEVSFKLMDNRCDVYITKELMSRSLQLKMCVGRKSTLKFSGIISAIFAFTENSNNMSKWYISMNSISF